MADPKQISSRHGDDGWEAQRQQDQAREDAARAAWHQEGREAVKGWDTTKGGTQAETPSEGGKQP